MKRLGVIAFVFLLWLSLSAVAQDTAASSAGGQQSTPTSQSTKSGKTKKAKAEHLKGKISQDGNTFTDDKTQKSWTITNPDAVKGHEGQDVRLTAQVSETSIHVKSVKEDGRSSNKGKGTPMSEQPPK
jgi:hypothetical protein